MTLNKQTASLVRKYLVEVCIICLACCVGFLFHQYNALNLYIRDTLQTVIIENTATQKEIQQFLDQQKFKQ